MADAELGEADVDEDDLIQSSMPLYLDHIFGTSIGFSQKKQHSAENSATSFSHPLSSSSAHRNSQPVIPAILESQGFHTKPFTGDEASSDGRNSDEESSCLPIPMQDTMSHPHITSSPGNSQQNSLVLFSSPDSSECQDTTSTGKSIRQNVMVAGTTSADKETTTSIQAKMKVKQSRKRRRSEAECEYHCPPSCCALRQCTSTNGIVCVIAIVVQVNVAMDVACRKGTMAGHTVSMSSLLLSDPTKSYFKLSLWRGAATWAERISIGDIVYFKNIRLKLWRGEVVGTTMARSSVLNLHQPNKKLASKVQQFVPIESVEELMKWGKKHLGYLFDHQAIPRSQKEVKFRTSIELIGDSVVHLHAKLLCLISSRMALLADHKGIDIHLHLLGKAASQWHRQLSGGVGQVWELMYVAVVCEGTQTQNSVCNLQTTSRTHFRMLDETCDAAREILKKVPSGASSGHTVVSGLTIADVISNRQSGTFKISAKAVSMEFILPDASRLQIKEILALPPPEMMSRLLQAVYVGCESCCQPLPQDANGIYCQCMSCILRLPGGYPSSSYFFQPMNVALTGAGLSLFVSQLTVPKILGFSGKESVQANLSGDLTKIQIEKLNRLFASAYWVVKCLVTKDENSFIEELSFSILNVELTSEHA